MPVGVLLMNLGTPDSPSVRDVRRYLKEFLSDPRVVNTPRIIWWPILNLIILNTRPKRSAAAYAKVWTEQGSPLMVISKQQAVALQSAMDDAEPSKYKVVLAMRYGQPSIYQGLQSLLQSGVKRIIALPLYPQYSDTTTASMVDAIEDSLAQQSTPPSWQIIQQYADNVDYIQSLASSVQQHWQANGRAEKLIMSFHGIPEAYAEAGDPYPDQCHQTAKLLAEALSLQKDQWLLTFQSRLGPKKWLQPYTDHSLKALAESGIKNVQVMCPGFSADCLETLEEIAMENRDIFLEAGGERYEYIACLNAEDDHINMMKSLVLDST